MATAPKKPAGTLPGREIKALWFALRRARSWRTLALVSADGARVDALAHQLAQIASLVPERGVMVVDALESKSGRIALGATDRYGVKAMPAGKSENEILGAFVPEATTVLANDAFEVVLVAVPSPVTHAWAIPLIALADAVVMCVEVDESRLRPTREMLQYLEPDRLIGSVLIAAE
jgi:hypothetical protein